MNCIIRNSLNKSLFPSIHSFNKAYYSSIQNDKTCDIAIIGAGIMGLNTAYQITRRSPSTKIKIFEKSPGPGYGSSGASSAICRTFYTFENQIKFSQDGMNLYQNWNDYLQYKNASAIFTKTGMLLMSPMTKQEVTEQQSKYNNLGVSTSIIDKYIMQSRFPQINPDIGLFDNNGEKEWIPKEMDENTFFFYEEDSGYFEPVQALTDLKNVLNENYSSNVSFYFNTNVNKIIHSNGNVNGIQIENKEIGNDTIYCNTIINSCGPWYNKIIKELNLDIKLTLTPVRIQVIYKDTPELYSENVLNSYGKEHNVPIPIIHDGMSDVYMRPQKQSKQILCSTAKEEEERDTIDPDNVLPSGADPEFRNKFLNSIYHRLEPILKPTSSKVHSLNGIYTVCEDDVHYIIGATKLNGFIVCNGFSGHGFKCAPAVGSMIAQYVTNIKIEGDTNVPIEFYSPYREPYTLGVKNVMA
eukprot:36953_1